MEETNILAEYAGALVTADVINREELLEEIHRAIAGEGTHVFYIRGEGGIGKTCLLRAVLRRCQPGEPWHQENLIAPAPERLVDLYHTVHHTRTGLAYGLRHSLPAPAGVFANFDKMYREWEEAKWGLAGMFRELSAMEDSVVRAFVEDFNNLAQRGYRLIIALDTAERLLYGEDEIQRRLEIDPERVEALEWLLEMLPQLQNAVVLIAGRPYPERLKDDLQQALGDTLQCRELGPFGLEETRKYFDAVAEQARRLGWQEQAEQIQGIPDDVREVIYYYTSGRPIMLALMIDYLLMADDLPAQVKIPVEEVRNQSPEERASVQQEVERALIRFWMETPREAVQAIQSLAWAPKGMDAELLARVADLRKNQEPQEWDVATAERWLKAVGNLSFVKTRPADGRVFLHDEMYKLFETHVLSGASSGERERIYNAIIGYYGEQIQKMRRDVRELSRPASPRPAEVALGIPQPPKDPYALALATARLWQTMAEEVHYRLHRNPVEGFQTYQLYARESYWSYEETLERLLYSEMLDFLKDRQGQEHLDGLLRARVEVTIGGIRRVERRRRENRFEDAVCLSKRIREECLDLLRQSGPLSRIQLQVLEAESLTYLGRNLEEAERLLRDTLWELEEFRPGDSFEEWQKRVLFAETYNVLGYCYRNMGWFRRAAEAYGRAVRQWRSLEQEEEDELRRFALRAQHANTLNNLSWALAELGRFAQATQVCEDALEMRVELGPAAPVAFTLNTYGMILVRDDKPHRARVLGSRALAIFRDLEYPRGVGLCDITLAESLRRMVAIPFVYTPEDGAELLRQAVHHANDAVDIFTNQVPERSRLVEALIERGCVYRQWAWLRPLYESADDPDQNELARRSEADLRRAMEEAGETFVFRRLDAHVNLAWLYYYMRRHEEAEQEARKALKTVPEDYRLEKGTPDVERLPHTFYWFLQGKTYLLLSELMMRRFSAGEGQEYLEKYGLYSTLALAYDEIYAPDFRDLRRALYRIYVRVRKLNDEEFKVLHQGIRQAVEEHHLKEPTRLDQALAEWGFPARLRG